MPFMMVFFFLFFSLVRFTFASIASKLSYKFQSISDLFLFGSIFQAFPLFFNKTQNIWLIAWKWKFSFNSSKRRRWWWRRRTRRAMLDLLWILHWNRSIVCSFNVSIAFNISFYNESGSARATFVLFIHIYWLIAWSLDGAKDTVQWFYCPLSSLQLKFTWTLERLAHSHIEKLPIMKMVFHMH